MKKSEETQLSKYRIRETFYVDFYVEATDYVQAKRTFDVMFDKNIQLGYDTWKELSNKNIRGGKLLVQVQKDDAITTVMDELWGVQQEEE